jgi:hypothetical protein
MIGNLLHWLQQHIKHWTKPATAVLIPGLLADVTRSRSDLIVENALLRQQLIVLHRQIKRPQLTNRDRKLFALLACLTKFWKQSMHIVQPDTLLRWHRELFRVYWRRKSQGQPKISAETIALIRKMGTENRLWGTIEVGDGSEQTNDPEIPAERAGIVFFEPDLGCLHKEPSQWHLGLRLYGGV